MEKGIIQLIVIFLLLVVILSLLGISLTKFTGNQTLRDNFSIINDWAIYLWNHFLKTPFLFVWEILSHFLTPLKEALRNLR